MISQKYADMLEGKSVIRSLSEFATNRGKEIGYENVFDYTLGNPSVPAPKIFTDIMIELLLQKDPVTLHGYSPSLGIESVRKDVAKFLNDKFAIPYTYNDIFMTSGAAGAIAHAIRCVTSPGDEIITFAPHFPEYVPYVNLTGAILRVVPPNYEDFQINFEELDKLINKKTMAILLNTPNNPTGIAYSEKTITTLVEILKEKEKFYGHDIFLISDEPYREIVFDNTNLPCVCKYYDNSIMCYSFSKSLSIPGERIGYIAFNPSCGKSEQLVHMCGQISRGIGHNCPASIIQLAMAKTINYTADLSVYETNMKLLYDCLKNLNFNVIRPTGTFYMFPKALEDDAKIFCSKALKYDLILVPGDSFGAPGYFRISYCMDTDKVQRSLKAFERFVENEYK